jgi:hypothetical protein
MPPVKSRPYADTSVSVDRSMAAVRQILQGNGIESFAFHERTDSAGLVFYWRNLAVRLRVPVEPGIPQEQRRVWRVIYWLLKSRFEAVEAGAETFEQAFLPHLMDQASGTTVYEAMTTTGAIRALGSGSV